VSPKIVLLAIVDETFKQILVFKFHLIAVGTVLALIFWVQSIIMIQAFLACSETPIKSFKTGEEASAGFFQPKSGLNINALNSS